ncbi:MULTISPECIES: hypothetical protein [unclassified Dysgonomonas]|uniref:hypothetical protein n=1 Tax=unclassified Dysgonomonas TaxID=2630389 RepID=UPI002476F5C5|nr:MULTISPECIES: hypothetical protein [unclassified Dysgonomonas]MDL2303308.1 hypothetical protein [Dysgonomonas sp. OttesenSCG-928-D17]
MKSINKNVALLEYGGSHTECMYFQIKSLKDNGYNVFLICNKSLVRQFPDPDIFSDILELHDTYEGLTNKEKWGDVKKLRRFTKTNNINTVVINTLEHRAVRNLLLLPLPKVKNYIGFVHYVRYMLKSGTFKWLYRKVKKVCVLSDSLLKVVDKYPRPMQLVSIYPIYYPSFDNYQLEKKEGEFWFCIPGAIVPQHRNIQSLLDAMSKDKLADNIRVVLLGPIESSIYPQIKKMVDDGNPHIIMFDSRVPQNVFDAYMKKTDVVLPLINSDFYGKYRISGTYNLAYGYRKAMLLEKEVQASNDDFKGISMSYTPDNIIERMNEISQLPDEYYTCRKAMENHPYLNIKTQCDKFIRLLEE